MQRYAERDLILRARDVHSRVCRSLTQKSARIPTTELLKQSGVVDPLLNRHTPIRFAQILLHVENALLFVLCEGLLYTFL